MDRCAWLLTTDYLVLKLLREDDLVQVNCNPPGNITVKVIDSRVDGGSYIALVLLDVSLSTIL